MFLRQFLIAMSASLLAAPAVASDLAATSDTHQEAMANIGVVLNHAKVLRLSKPAATVIIGNPDIADATVRDPRTIVLTGRSFGETNMVILDATGAPIIDERIVVSRNEDETLKVYRRAIIQTLSCNPYCEQAYLSEAEQQSLDAMADSN